MSVVSALCALAVGAVLLVSGIAKIGESRATSRAIRDLRVPGPLRNDLMAQAMPVVELMLAVGQFLVPSGWHRLPAVLAALLMTTFVVLLARVVRQRKTVTCICFGTFDGGAVDRTAVIRNGVLTLAAAT